ncbi:MFS transporter [Rhodococcoides fascians]|uniref:MFS transporter n=1 Tax=Rhodococcoides fascians TaxID=1828 RepID=UPI0037A2002E
MTDLPPSAKARESRRVAVATFVGTTLEWYDFYLYALCAALVFGPLFFSSSDPVTGQLGALATLAVGFVARPVGGVIAGHFGDRLGRKKMLVWTLLIMGGATVAVGLVPTYQQIGLWAPVVLVVLRIVQGLAMGGEWGGAVSMAIEHAPANRRALYSSAPMVGPGAGLVLANLMLLALIGLTGDSFAQWGWRFAFVSSAVLIAVGIYARRQLTESPLFEQSIAQEPARVPILEVLRSHRATLLTTLVVAGVPGISTYMVYTYTLSYGTNTIGYDRSSLLWIAIAVSAISIPLTVIFARFGDRFGVFPILMLGSIAQIGTAIILFPLFDSGNLVLAALASLVSVAAACLSFGCVAPMLASKFPPSIRYTGISLSYQLGSVVGGGFAPLIATSLFASTGNSFFIGLYMAGANVLALGCLLYLSAKTVTENRSSAQSTDSTPHTRTTDLAL